jgi:hypothetical protein
VFGMLITMESAGVEQEETLHFEQLIHEVLVLGMIYVAPNQLSIEDVTTTANTITQESAGIVCTVALGLLTVIEDETTFAITITRDTGIIAGDESLAQRRQ